MMTTTPEKPEMCHPAESDTSVLTTRDFWRRGVQVSEAAITYAIYIMILVGAVAGAVYIYGAITGSKVQADTTTLVRAVQEMFAADAHYEGLAVPLMAQSERLPEQFIAGTEAAPEIWVGGQQGAFPVALFPGIAGATNVSATSNRFFVVVVGNADVPVRDVDTCSELVSLELPGLRGVQVLTAATSTAVPTTAAGTPPAADGNPTANVAWNVVEGRGGLLRDRIAATVQLACQAQDNKMIVYGVN